MIRVETYVHFGALVDGAAVTRLQRAIGDRLRVPCQRMQTEDGEQVYAVDLLDHSGTVAEACVVVEREVLRWVEEHAVPGAVQVERIHAWRNG